MRISEFKTALQTLNRLNFMLPDGAKIPPHFHITEAGLTTYQFIDCGGTIRHERHISLQIWVANDYEHRLSPEKLLKILDASAGIIGNDDLEIQLEYQADTISRYGVALVNDAFQFQQLFTNCLAADKCGIPTVKPKLKLSALNTSSGSEKAEGKCC